MELHDKNAEKLLEVLEELRLLLASGLPAIPTPQKKPSWEDVWRKGSYPVTTAPVSRSRSRLSDAYTKSLRALGLSST